MSSKTLLTFRPEEVVVEPFPHIVKEGVLEPELYRALKEEFPLDEVFDRNETTGGRAGRALYRGDSSFEEHLSRSPAWMELHQYLNSQRFIELVVRLFGEHMQRFECYTDPEKARFVDHVEGREELASRSRVRQKVENTLLRFARPKRTDELFVRMDLAQGAPGYGKPVHCDRPNRLVSMLIYFCDADEIGLEGGDLIVNEPLEKKPYQQYPRHPRPEDVGELTRLRARDNLGLIFLCTNNSYHSVSKIRAQQKYRNFIYCSVTGMGPKLWPITS